MRLLHKVFGAGFLALAASASAQPTNPALVDSPWTTWHGNTYRQASIDLPGPRSGEPSVVVSSFEEEAGEEFGTSPWHILSARRYRDAPRARAIWGVSLQHVYKYIVDGDRFELVDHEKINHAPFSVGWNFHILADDRVLVPNTNGMRLGSRACRTRHPAFLIYRDGDESGSPIECVGNFEFSPRAVQDACGFRGINYASTPVFSDVLHDGSIAARIVRGGGGDRKETWIAIIDNDLTQIQSCTRAFSGAQTNGGPLERLPGGGTRIFVPTDTSIAAFDYDPRTRAVMQSGEVPVPFRARTGTTPTLVETDGRRFLVVIDARCAVNNVFRGTIACDRENRSPSALVAIPLPLGSGEPLRTDLPDYMNTVENSPAASGGTIVVANYSGYTPDGPRDGQRERATGIVGLTYSAQAGRFVVAWGRPELQISGIPTISRVTGLVYGSGSEPDRQTYFYGLDLSDGSTRQRALVGPSYDTRARPGIFDAGNSIVINDDGSAIWPGGEVLVRVRDQ